MDTNFAFPTSQRPIPRNKPPSTTGQSRESSALRASVLDVALELGITNNSLVAAWMFDNTLKEEEEEEEPVASPGLTNSSSTASDEGRYPPTPPELGLGSGILPNKGKPMSGWEHSGIPFPSDNSGLAGSVPFPNQPVPARPTTPSTAKKLRKKNRDGYESDGGYLSEGAKKAQKKEEKARLKEEKREQKEEERKRKKSFGAIIKSGGSKKVEDSGYETDGAAAGTSKSPFKSKSKKSKAKNASPDAGPGDETDAGYVSTGSGLKKPKGRFFKLSLKGSRSDLKAAAEAADKVPPMPTDPLPLPIAQRFASPPGSAKSPTQGSTLDMAGEGRPSAQSTTPFRLPAPGAPLELLTLETTQPISMEGVTTSSCDLPLNQPTQTFDRSSLSSSSSASSSVAQRLRPSHFASSQEASAGHGLTASISTLNSTNLGSNGHSTYQHSTYATSPSKATTPTSPMSATGSSNLSISYPITRGSSPIPPSNPITPVNVSKSHLHNLPQLDVHSRNASPLPHSPNSPYVMVTPSNPHAPSPIHSAGLPPPSPSNLRPRNPQTDGFGPHLTSPPPTSGRLSPNPAIRGRRVSPLLAPDDHSDATLLPSPNVLAYYDIPPPSPPPMGPLPNVPTNSGPPPSQLRAKVLERQRNGHDISASLSVAQPGFQRGREPPFPTRPVLSPTSPSEQGPAAPSAHVQHVPGLEARARIPRYPRAASPLPPASVTSRPEHSLSPAPMQRQPMNEPVVPWERNSAMEGPQRRSSRESEQEDVLSDAEEMRDVLDRFVDTSEENVPLDRTADASRPLPVRRSSEALRVEGEYNPRDTVYTWEDDGTRNNRESRWSGSIYSRLSILDEEESGEARDRFLKRVESMMRKKEKDEIVPPVPNIAEGLANARSWNKF